MSNVC
jgi:UDP-N-acetylglucosamine/UDP-N-acetylgalactosamine diphosphorylase